MNFCPNCPKQEYFKTTDLEVSYCTNCLHYLYNPNSVKELLLSHKLVGDYQQETREKKFKKVFNYILAKHSNPTFLEIGAGFGGYIKYANSLGFQCTAVDIDEHYKDSYIKSGIEFIQMDGNFFNLKVNQHFVILSHIIEHLINPKSLIDHLNKQDVSYLIIEVPNSKGFIFQLSRIFIKFNIYFIWDRLWQKHSNSPHLHYFSDQSLNKMLLDSGYKVEKTFSSRFSSIKGSFKRTRVTQGYVLSLISVIFIQVLELINFLFNRPENKIYIAHKL